MSLAEASAMARNRNLRMAGVEATPELLFVSIYNRLTRDGITLEVAQGHWYPDWRLVVDEEPFYLHRAKDALRITHIGDQPSRRVYDRYTVGGAFGPRDGDTVVDVGSFIGEFSWQVAAAHDVDVVAVEPDPRNAECVSYNTPESVEVRRCAASYQDGSVDFHVATDGSESGILPPDKGRAGIEEVSMARLDSLVDAVDFLKVEAEGNEPEVLLGMGRLRPKRVVVNVSPERNGHSPADTCQSILRDKGYVTDRDGDELFATIDSV